MKRLRINWACVGFAVYVNLPTITLFAFVVFVDLTMGGGVP